MRTRAALACLAAVGVAAAACGGTSGGSSGSSTTASSGSHANVAAYCDQIHQFQQGQAAVQSDPNQVRTVFAAWDRAATAAPSEIAPSVQTINAAYQKILSTVGSTDLRQNPQAFQNAANGVIQNQQNQLQTAGKKVTDYTKRTCGIDLNSSSSGSTSTTKP